MDIKAEVEKLVEKLKSDPDLMKKYKSDPVKAVEELTGKDLPDDQIKALADGIKGKLTAEAIMGSIGKGADLFK